MKNLDLAAGLTMLLALVLEGATYLAQDESLLGQFPPALGPIVLALAAFARWRMAQPKPEPKVVNVDSESAVPEHVDLDPTPIVDLWPGLDDEVEGDGSGEALPDFDPSKSRTDGGRP